MGTVIPFPTSRAGGSDRSNRSNRSNDGATSTQLSLAAPGRALLWREAVGHELRRERSEQSRTLADVAGQAGVSTQYLSEVERGRKEPSSEVLEAVAEALSLTLLDLTLSVSHSLASTGTRSPTLSAA